MSKHTTLTELFIAIANAIRLKTGDTSTITADNFPDAIVAIKTHEFEDAILEQKNELTEYSNDRITKLEAGAFRFNHSLQQVSFTKVFACGRPGTGELFEDCNSLKTANFPKLLFVAPCSFLGSNQLSNIYCPQLAIISKGAFQGCLGLKKLDIGNVEYEDWKKWTDQPEGFFTGDIYERAFSYTGLDTLIIRFKYGVFDLENINAFEETPIAHGVGYIYVPRALVEQYKTAEIWSAFANQIRALEDYTVDGTVTGKFNYNLI